jgi:hypothetical protein
VLTLASKMQKSEVSRPLISVWTGANGHFNPVPVMNCTYVIKIDSLSILHCYFDLFLEFVAVIVPISGVRAGGGFWREITPTPTSASPSTGSY